MRSKVQFDDITEVLPHAAPMILVDEVLSYGDDYVEVLVSHDKPSIFTDDHGNVPVWVGIEYMAQAISTYAGIMNLRANRPVQIGLLLGTRHYKAFTRQFEKGRPVTVTVKELYRDDENLVLFDCEIRAETVLASAQIKAIQPENLGNTERG